MAKEAPKINDLITDLHKAYNNDQMANHDDATVCRNFIKDYIADGMTAEQCIDNMSPYLNSLIARLKEQA